MTEGQTEKDVEMVRMQMRVRVRVCDGGEWKVCRMQRGACLARSRDWQRQPVVGRLVGEASHTAATAGEIPLNLTFF